MATNALDGGVSESFDSHSREMQAGVIDADEDEDNIAYGKALRIPKLDKGRNFE